MDDLSRWPHADAILDRALELPPAERRAFVRAAAEGDDALRSALEAVLAEAETDDGFLAAGGALAGAVGIDFATADAEDAVPHLGVGSRVGAYEVGPLIGRGGMGEVYRARDTRLGRDVAIKVLPRRLWADPLRHARLDREARLLASLNHPHIAAIYDIEEEGGNVALVLELVEGPTLAEVVARTPGTGLPLADVLRLAGELAAALLSAHARGIVHRDLKPSNVKLTEAGAVKVLDFGIARALAPDRPADAPPLPPTASVEGRADGVIGTASYMSPEHARGLATDHRGDIWAFGCVLYELATGVRAFDGNTTTEIIARVLERDPDFSRLPAGTPPALRRLVERALRKDPSRRLSHVGDALLEIEDAEAELSARPVARAGPAPRSRRVPGLTAAATLVAGLVGGAALVWWWPAAPPAETLFLAIPVAEEDDLVAGEAPGIAVSPDGRTVVYRAWRSGRIELVRRSLATGLDEVLPSSADGSAPFFSPDGQWIGFSTQAEILKVPVAGGPAVVVTRSAGGARASWATSNAIVFSTDAGRGLYTVPAVGGEPRLVSSPDEAVGHLLYESPDVLPGGRQALVTIRLADRQEVGVADLETGVVSLLVDGRQPRFVPGDRIVFARDSTLWAAPFDPLVGTLGGDPVPIVDDLDRGALGGAPHFDVSDEGTLVYLPRRQVPDTRTPVWISMAGEETPVPVDSRSYTRASLSPDGARIALAEASPDNRDIWVYDMARGTLMRLTTDPATDTAPIWSPDGREIAFRSDRDGGGLFLSAADGSGAVTRLTTVEGPSRPAHTPYAFTPDGRSVLFTELRSYADQGIGVVDREATPRARMLIDGPYAETRPALSPDGAWLAYQSDETGRYEVYVRPYPAVEGSRTQVSTRGGTSPRWRPDGRAIFFHDGSSMVEVAVTPGTPVAIGQPRPLFEASRYSERLGPLYDITPSGDRFLFLREGGPDGHRTRRGDLRLVRNFLSLTPNARGR